MDKHCTCLHSHICHIWGQKSWSPQGQQFNFRLKRACGLWLGIAVVKSVSVSRELMFTKVTKTSACVSVYVYCIFSCSIWIYHDEMKSSSQTTSCLPTNKCLQRHLVKEWSKFIWMLLQCWHNTCLLSLSAEQEVYSEVHFVICRYWLYRSYILRQGSENATLWGTGGQTERKTEISATSVDGSSITPW